MDFIEDKDMYMNYESKQSTDAKTTENDDFFSNKFFGDFPTEGNCPRKSAKRKNHETSGTTAENVDGVEKSPRQARRNARERGRKARLNAAFKVLRDMVPKSLDSSASHERKLTQVEILRLAKNYICSLTSMLDETNCNDDARVSYQDFNSTW